MNLGQGRVGEGVKKSKKFADIRYGSPLTRPLYGFLSVISVQQKKRVFTVPQRGKLQERTDDSGGVGPWNDTAFFWRDNHTCFESMFVKETLNGP